MSSVDIVTGSPDLKFRVQGKLVDCTNPRNVRLDSNVRRMLLKGALVIYKVPPVVMVKEKKKIDKSEKE
jgi:hypothetical protein